MTTKEIEELLWKRRDDELSQEERALLDRALAESEDVRDLAREVDGMAKRLKVLADSETPAELRGRIDRILSSSTSNRGEGRPIDFSPRGSRRGKLHEPAMRYAALAAALLVAIVGGWIVAHRQPNARNDSLYVGTMESPPISETSAQTFELGGSLGSVSVERSAEGLLINLDLTKKGAVEVDLQVAKPAGGTIAIVQFSGSTRTAPQTAHATASWFVSAPGQFSLTIAPKPADADLDLVVKFGDREVLRKRLSESRHAS